MHILALILNFYSFYDILKRIYRTGKIFERSVFRMNLYGRDFLKLLDFSKEEIEYFLDTAADLKAKKLAGVPHRYLDGKNVALIFEKTSTRTRCSFEVAAADLGMHSVYLSPEASQIGTKESIPDTARVLSSMFDGIEYRGFGQSIVEELAEYASVPVWNGLTNEYHPTQILADFLTVREHFGTLDGIKLAYMGDARYNMGNSLMVGCAKLGVDFSVGAPMEYFPNDELTAQCKKIAAENGSRIDFCTDPYEAARDANVIYTDVWVSMGESTSVWEERVNALSPYQVNSALMNAAADNAVFMHCLPSYHDLKTKIGLEMCTKFGRSEMEVTDEIFESERSLVFEEAGNRMHTIKAVMLCTLGKRE